MSLFSENLNINLNPDQQKAVNHFKGPALVLAIPGSGKTTMLICRTMTLIEGYQVDPKRILSLTFSKAAALDMAHRMEKLFPNNAYNIGFSTIHRFCYSVLLRYFDQINRQYILLESKESPISKQQLLRKLYRDITQDYLSEDVLEELNTAIGYVKNMEIHPNLYEDHRIQKFPQIFDAYESYKRQNLLMDFDDMLTMCKKLFVAKPAILKHYQDRFDFIQVDESQDTSKVQHEIIELLAQKHGNIFMVADDDQSIYGFRGAYPEAILTMDQKYPDLVEYQLKTNYRSSAGIIDLCQRVIDQNATRKQKVFQHHNPQPSKLEMVHVDTTSEQCAYILDAHKANDLSKAVLYRNNLSMIPLVDYLDREDVDFTVRDQNHAFFTNWCVLDVIAFIKVALVPNDISNFERIYYKMNAFLSKVQMNYLKEHFNGISVLSSLIDLPDLESFKRATFRKIKANFEYLANLSPDLAIDFIEDELGYRQHLVNHCKKNNINKDTPNKYIDIMKSIAKHTDSLSDFMHRLNHLKEIIYRAARNSNPYALNLLTMHASKGLEFDHVFIIDMDHNTFPSKYALDLQEENILTAVEEERRLFYVALSRAKHSITLVHTKFKNGQYNKSSEFLTEYEKGAHNLQRKSHKEDIKSQLNGFEIGDKLLHTSFGVGILVDVDGDRIMIEFKDSTKTLSAALCLDSKIIMKID